MRDDTPYVQNISTPGSGSTPADAHSKVYDNHRVVNATAPSATTAKARSGDILREW